MTVKGKVKEISSTKTVSDKFEYIDLILTTDQKYNPDICIQFSNKSIDKLQGIKVGYYVSCAINLISRNSKGRWFSNISGWDIEVLDESDANDLHHEMADQGENDELPF